MSDDHTCAIDDAGYCDTCGKLMWPRPVSEPEITDEMVEWGAAKLATVRSPLPGEVREVTVLDRLDALAVLTAALSHSPLLAENKALKSQLEKTERAYDDLGTERTTTFYNLSDENKALKEDRRHWEKMACHWWDSVRVLKEENEKLRREMRMYDHLLSAAPTQGENE